MKKKIWIIPVIIAIVVATNMAGKKAKITNEASLTPQEQCFSRSTSATPEAPYAVNEKVQLFFDGTRVAGIKSGTQSGPDMTNGYEGMLSGIREDAILSLLFSYTIEGAQQKEAELYLLTKNTLIKKRYPLIEKDGILVPDTTKSFIEQPYAEIPCQ